MVHDYKILFDEIVLYKLMGWFNQNIAHRTKGADFINGKVLDDVARLQQDDGLL